MGQLVNMSGLCLTIVLCLCVSPWQVQGGNQTCPIDADIILVLDSSASIGANNFQKVLKLSSRLTNHFTIGPADVRFGTIIYSSSTHKIFDLQDCDTQQSLAQSLVSAQFLNQSTETHIALGFIIEQGMLNINSGGRLHADKIVLVITDGWSRSFLQTTMAAKALKDEGVNIISVGIGDIVPVQLESMASSARNVFTTPSYEALEEIETKVASRICQIPKEREDVDECQNNTANTLCEQTCTNTVGSYKCSCRIGYKIDPANPRKCQDINECIDTDKPSCKQICKNTVGSYKCSCQEGFRQKSTDSSQCEDINECSEATTPLCQYECVNMAGNYRCSCPQGFVVRSDDTSKCDKIETCTTKADIIYVIDASGSIGVNRYKIQMDFACRLTEHFKIGLNDVLFGAITFSNGVKKLFDLNEFSDHQSISVALHKATYLTGQTYTNVAFNFIDTNGMFNASAGGRPNVVKIVLLLTDGASTEHQLTLQAAKHLKDNGRVIIAVGIGNTVWKDELNAVATSTNDVFVAASFELLDYVEQRVAHSACQH